MTKTIKGQIISDVKYDFTLSEEQQEALLGGFPTRTEVDDDLSAKQDKLVAGDNITIENNVISATASGGGVIILEAKNVTPIAGGKYSVDIYNGDEIWHKQEIVNAIKNDGYEVKIHLGGPIDIVLDLMSIGTETSGSVEPLLIFVTTFKTPSITTITVGETSNVYEVINLQQKLTAGDNINIENNTISAKTQVVNLVYDADNEQFTKDGVKVSFGEISDMLNEGVLVTCEYDNHKLTASQPAPIAIEFIGINDTHSYTITYFYEDEEESIDVVDTDLASVSLVDSLNNKIQKIPNYNGVFTGNLNTAIFKDGYYYLDNNCQNLPEKAKGGAGGTGDKILVQYGCPTRNYKPGVQMLYSYNADFGYTYYMRTYYILGFNTDPMTNPVYQQWKEMTPIEGGGLGDNGRLVGVNLNNYRFKDGIYNIDVNTCANLPQSRKEITGNADITTLIQYSSTNGANNYAAQILTYKKSNRTCSFIRTAWYLDQLDSKIFSLWIELGAGGLPEPTKVYVSFGDGSQDPEDGIGIYSQPDRQGTRYTSETLHNLLVAEKNNVIVVNPDEGTIYRLTIDAYDTWYTIYFSTTYDLKIISLYIEGDSVYSSEGDLSNHYTKTEIDSKIGNIESALNTIITGA